MERAGYKTNWRNRKMIEFEIGLLVGMGFSSLIAIAWVQYEESSKQREEQMVKRLAEELSRRQK